MQDARTSATSLQHLSCYSIKSIVFLTYETNSSFMFASESCTAISQKQIHIYDQRAPSTELATHTDTERLSEEIPWSTFNFHSASIPMVQK